MQTDIHTEQAIHCRHRGCSGSTGLCPTPGGSTRTHPARSQTHTRGHYRFQYFSNSISEKDQAHVRACALHTYGPCPGHGTVQGWWYVVTLLDGLSSTGARDSDLKTLPRQELPMKIVDPLTGQPDGMHPANLKTREMCGNFECTAHLTCSLWWTGCRTLILTVMGWVSRMMLFILCASKCDCLSCHCCLYQCPERSDAGTLCVIFRNASVWDWLSTTPLKPAVPSAPHLLVSCTLGVFSCVDCIQRRGFAFGWTDNTAAD